MRFRSFYVGEYEVINSIIWAAEKERDRVLVRLHIFGDGNGFFNRFFRNTPNRGSVSFVKDQIFYQAMEF